ncbi:MAG: ornithine cyclodeaminase family protein [Clostridia bacterium]|nr:ornithine cyclodeaminase family protein [Clostridia bacterium]
MIYLKREEIKDLLDFNEIFNSMKNGFKLYSQGKTVTPPYIDFSIPDIKRGHVHFKSGYIIGEKYFTLKYSSGFWSDDVNGLLDNGLFIVFNAKNGRQECIIDDIGYLTDYRTGVAGAIATKTLARANSEIVTVVGTGIQARMQIQSLMNVINIKKLNVWGRNKENASIYISEIKTIYPELIVEQYDSIEDSIKEADIIITTTYSSTPLLKSEWIKDGTHITAVGSCGPDMQEIDENIFNKAKVFADSKEMCSKYGEISYALKNSIIKFEDIIEVGEVIDTFKRNEADITVVDLVGLGFQDAVIGSYVYEKAMIKKRN